MPLSPTKALRLTASGFVDIVKPKLKKCCKTVFLGLNEASTEYPVKRLLPSSVEASSEDTSQIHTNPDSASLMSYRTLPSSSDRIKPTIAALGVVYGDNGDT